MGKQRQNWTAAPWDDREELEVAMVIPETADTATIAFRSPTGAWFDYQPGQFLTLDLPVPGGPLSRTYTISSSPSRPLSISITVKAQSGSIGTRWMLDNLKPGMRIKAHGPAGQFTFLRHPAKKYLFISAGSGITPMMSMTMWAWDSGEMPDIAFVHAARKPADIIFKRRLEQFAARVPGLQLRFTVEEVDPFEVWSGFRGRLSQIMLGLMAPDYLDREVFCCGPEPFMRSVREMLARSAMTWRATMRKASPPPRWRKCRSKPPLLQAQQRSSSKGRARRSPAMAPKPSSPWRSGRA